MEAGGRPGGTCFSCHTNMTYLLARPVLRAALGESAPTRIGDRAGGWTAARLKLKDAQQIKPPISIKSLWYRKRSAWSPSSQRSF